MSARSARSDDRRRPTALVLLLLLAVAAFSTQAVAETPAQTTGVALGLAVPTSGTYAPIGKQLVEAAQIAARETGAQLIVADTGGEPAEAVKAVQTLAANPAVVAIVGPLGQRESQAAASAAQRAGVPMFTLTTSDSVNRAGGWIFRVRASVGEQARALAEVSRESLDNKSAAILYPQSAYGEEAALAFADEFLRRGGRVATVANYREDTTDFANVLSVLVGEKVYLGKDGTVDRWKTDASGFARTRPRGVVDFDVLFIPDHAARVARLLPFLPGAGIQNGEGGEQSEAGTAVQMLGLAAWQGQAMELSGGDAAGAIYLDTFAGETAGGRQEEFSRVFASATGRAPVDIEAETFDIVWLLGTLGRRVVEGGKPDARAQLVRLLPRRDVWNGVAGGLRFDASGKPLRNFGVYRFDAGGFVSPMF